ncbi:MAG: hypothetical protein LW724_14910 [Planctomycetaceae bacterium]|jgi:hypothetical protein|nr:hypothetical protein [Planctomycetaceae bacterium]
MAKKKVVGKKVNSKIVVKKVSNTKERSKTSLMDSRRPFPPSVKERISFKKANIVVETTEQLVIVVELDGTNAKPSDFQYKDGSFSRNGIVYTFVIASEPQDNGTLLVGVVNLKRPTTVVEGEEVTVGEELVIPVITQKSINLT